MEIKKDTYTMRNDVNKKMFYIILNGFFTIENLNEYIKDYNEMKSQLDLVNTSIVIDGSELKVFAKDLEDKLGELYLDYAKFKQVYVALSSQLVSKMQLERMLRAQGIDDKFKFIKSIDEAK